MDRREPYLILGIGNSLLSDDGVGIHAVNFLRKEPPRNTILVAPGTDFLSAAPFLERCTKALVIDAMDTGQPPGSLHYCSSRDLVEIHQIHSLHELGLLAVLEFLDGKSRPEVHILGVQPGRIELGLQLSPPVASALPQVVRAARRIIAEFEQ